MNNKGFSMIETIVGFFLFSLMMLLYLPAYYNEMRRMDDVILHTRTWHLFTELVDIHLDSELSEDIKSLVSDDLIYNWEETNNEVVIGFGCQIDFCSITLGNGSELYIEIQEIDF